MLGDVVVAMSIVCDNNFVSSWLQHHTISRLLHGTVNWKHLVWELKASLDLAWSILGAKELWWSPDALAFLVFILLPWKFSSCRCPVKCGGRLGGNHCLPHGGMKRHVVSHLELRSFLIVGLYVFVHVDKTL